MNKKVFNGIYYPQLFSYFPQYAGYSLLKVCFIIPTLCWVPKLYWVILFCVIIFEFPHYAGCPHYAG